MADNKLHSLHVRDICYVIHFLFYLLLCNTSTCIFIVFLTSTGYFRSLGRVLANPVILTLFLAENIFYYAAFAVGPYLTKYVEIAYSLSKSQAAYIRGRYVKLTFLYTYVITCNPCKLSVMTCSFILTLLQQLPMVNTATPLQPENTLQRGIVKVIFSNRKCFGRWKEFEDPVYVKLMKKGMWRRRSMRK